MSVLRKRSPWSIPAAGLILGILALGLAGCGGGDDSGTPIPVDNIPSNVPAPIALTATHPVPVVSGQGATVEGTVLDPALFNGATGITAVIPPGVLSGDATLGIELTPELQSTIARAIQAGQSGFPESLAEFSFGQLGAGSSVIDASRPVVFNGNVTITIPLTSAQYLRVSNMITQTNCVLRAYRITVTPGASQATLSRADGCTVSLTTNGSGGGSIVLTGQCSGNIVVFCVPPHLQGGIG